MALTRPKNVPVANLDGVLSNSQLPTFDNSLFPSGSVIQVQHYRYDPDADTYDTIAQDTLADSPLTAVFTPMYANSKLFITTMMHTRIINANGITFGIKRDGVSIPGMSQRGGASKDFFYKSDSVNHHYTGRCQAYIDANSTASTTFKIWAQGWSGGTWEISYGHGEHTITVMEIKQ